MALTVVYSNAFGGVCAEDRGGTVSNYVPDTLGSTIGLTSSAGVLTDRWEYWPYGEVASRTGSNVTPLTFLGILGYFQDVINQLFYVRARHLRSDLARWLTVDPLWPKQPAYLYANDAPALFPDASGLGICDQQATACNNWATGDFAACLLGIGILTAIVSAMVFVCWKMWSTGNWEGALTCLTIVLIILLIAYEGAQLCLAAYQDNSENCSSCYCQCELTGGLPKGPEWNTEAQKCRVYNWSTAVCPFNH